LHAPHLLDVEVAQVIRRYAASGEIDGERGRTGRCCMDRRRGWRPEPGRRKVVPFSVRNPAVPFKHNAARRHHIPKPRYRVTNWLA
jgi:hypothetical protein